MKLRESLYLLFAVLAPGLAYRFFLDDLRNKAAGAHGWDAYMLSIAPNFIGAFSLGAALFLAGLYFWKRATKPQIAFAAAAGSILAVSAWEVAQFILPDGEFGWHDLAWTIMGAALYLFIARGWFATGWNERSE